MANKAVDNPIDLLSKRSIIKNMKFTKGKDAQERGQKGGKNTLKTYGFGHFKFLANKRWAVYKSLAKNKQAE